MDYGVIQSAIDPVGPMEMERKKKKTKNKKQSTAWKKKKTYHVKLPFVFLLTHLRDLMHLLPCY
jgi:hypothetical protein